MGSQIYRKKRQRISREILTQVKGTDQEELGEILAREAEHLDQKDV